ncbi:MAG TPA: cytosine permease [Pseudonocardia sp.]|jgi:cytosine permease|nr:cytosine permease [Pseudonocardia sp.]
MTAVTNSPATTEAHGLTSEFEHEAVPPAHRRSWLSVAAVWFGFPMILTNAVFGGVIVYGLGLVRGLLAILLGNMVLMLYVGVLSHLAGSTGRNFAIVAKSTFGSRGYAIASGFLSTIVIGWFAFQTGLTGATLHSTLGWNEPGTILLAGVLYIAVTFIGIRALAILGAVAAPLFIVLAAVAIGFIASQRGLGGVLGYGGHPGATVLSIGAAVTMTVAGFADSGTMTADFTRWSRSGRHAVGASATAFPLANFVSMAVGGVIVATGAATDPDKDGGDFLGILVGHHPVLTALAVVFVFINLGSVCTHCLYNGAVGWSHITASKMRLLTIILGIIGVVAAVAGVWTLFADWLNILGVFVPPIGAVLITDQVLLRRRTEHRATATFRPTAFAAWAIGAVVAAIVHFTAPQYAEAVAGIVAATIAYLVITRFTGSSSSATGAATADYDTESVPAGETTR